MNMGDTFPLFAVPGRIKTVILQEFQGRCPTVQEVVQRSDKQWLAVPGVGLSALGIIRSVTVVQLATEEATLSTSMSDDKLLDRLTSIQEELRRIHDMLTAKIEATSGRGSRLTTHHRVHHPPAATH